MNRKVNCRLQGVGQWLALRFEGDSKIGLSADDAGQVCLEDGIGGGHRLYRLGEWIVQRAGGRLIVSAVPDDQSGRTLYISFHDPDKVDLGLSSSDGAVNSSYSAVKQLFLQRSGENATVNLTLAGSSSRRPPTRTPQADPVAPANSEELERLRAQLAEAQTRLAEAQTEAQARQAEARAALEAEQRESRLLRERLDAGMAEYVRELSAQQAADGAALGQAEAEAVRLLREVERQRQALTDAQRGNREQQSLSQTLQQQVVALQEQELGRLAAVRELSELDVEACRERLADARPRLLADEDAMALLADDPVLRTRGVSDALEEARKAFDGAEKRLARVIRLREQINRSVNREILSEDGVLPGSEEVGESSGSVG